MSSSCLNNFGTLSISASSVCGYIMIHQFCFALCPVRQTSAILSSLAAPILAGYSDQNGQLQHLAPSSLRANFHCPQRKVRNPVSKSPSRVSGSSRSVPGIMLFTNLRSCCGFPVDWPGTWSKRRYFLPHQFRGATKKTRPNIHQITATWRESRIPVTLATC